MARSSAGDEILGSDGWIDVLRHLKWASELVGNEVLGSYPWNDMLCYLEWASKLGANEVLWSDPWKAMLCQLKWAPEPDMSCRCVAADISPAGLPGRTCYDLALSLQLMARTLGDRGSSLAYDAGKLVDCCKTQR